MAEIFRRLGEIMIVIYYSHDFYDPLTSLKNWCYKGQRIISTQHSAMQCNAEKPSTALNALIGCQRSTSPLVLSFGWDD